MYGGGIKRRRCHGMNETSKIILIAPVAAAAAVLKKTPTEIHYFTSVEDFDRWRNGQLRERCATTLCDLVDQLVAYASLRSVGPYHRNLSSHFTGSAIKGASRL